MTEDQLVAIMAAILTAGGLAYPDGELRFTAKEAVGRARDILAEIRK